VTAYLLDTNLLVALYWPSHAQHDVAATWFADHRAEGWATCPITEAGFVRIVSNPQFSRAAVRPRDAIAVLSANTSAADHVFWPDDAPYSEVAQAALERLMGHQQVTDAYLLGLAVRRGGALATLDEGILQLTMPGSPEHRALVLIT
jgi:toxin-antitoxin system PIN domain toxin